MALPDWLAYGFVQNAIVASVLVAFLGAVVGFFIVLRRMAFVAVGVSHAALGGVALGILLGGSPLLWAIAFSIAVALGMASLGRRGMHEDTAMGVFFPAAMAFGVVVIGLSPTWQRNLMAYLFGNILAVQPADLWWLAGTCLLVLVVVWAFFKELLFVSFDEESAHASGVPVAAMRRILLVLTAVSVVVAIKVVGVVLVSAMLVIPTAAACQVTSRWQVILGLGLVVALTSLLAGLAISFQMANVPTGPAAVLVATGLFALGTVAGRLAGHQAAIVHGPGATPET